MSAPNPFNLVNRDEEHLRLLSLFHLIYSGLQGITLIFFILIPLISGPAYYHALGMPMPPNPKQLETILVVSLLIRGLLVFLTTMNGLSLRKQQYWLTCVILSILECGSIILTRDELGTLLGISAVLVLRRESVKTLFKAKRPHQASNANASN